jgi:hypothetical protein
MPRYNFNNEDVDLLIRCIDHEIEKTVTPRQIKRLTTLKNRLMLRVKGERYAIRDETSS